MQYLLKVLPAVPIVFVVTCALYFFLAHTWKSRYQSQSKGVKTAAFFLTGWFVMFIYVTQIMSFGNGMGQSINLRPLHDFYIAWRYGSNNAPCIWQFLLNIVMFVPLGLLLPVVSKKYRHWHRTIWAAFVLSLATELLQLISSRGTDIDDLIANTLGGVFGYALFVICLQIIQAAHHQKAGVHKGQVLISVLGMALILLPFAGIRMMDGSSQYGSLYYGHLMPQKLDVETTVSTQETHADVYQYTEQISLSDLQQKLASASGLSGTWQDGDGSSCVSCLIDGNASIYIYNCRRWDAIVAEKGKGSGELPLSSLQEYAENDMAQYGISGDEVTYAKDDSADYADDNIHLVYEGKDRDGLKIYGDITVTLATDGTLLEIADNRIWCSFVSTVKCISPNESLSIAQDVGAGPWQGTAVVTSVEAGYAFIDETGYLIPVWQISGKLEGSTQEYDWNPVIDAVK